MTYDIKQFAKLASVSVRTVRRHIADGKATDGKDWTPEKKQGKYVFYDKDLARWQSDGDDKAKTARHDNPQITIDINAIFSDLKSLSGELIEAKSNQIALTSQATSLASDYDRIKDKYIEAQARIRMLEIQIEQQTKRIKELENRPLIKRIFDI